MPDNPQPSKESVEAAEEFMELHCWENGDPVGDLEKWKISLASVIDGEYRRGRESMREEAAKKTEEVRIRVTPPNDEVMWAVHDTSRLIAGYIRSLPLTEVKKDGP